MKMENVEEIKLKPMKCELDYLSKSDGSAILSQGETVVIASVNGPLDVKIQSQNIERAVFEVQYNPKTGRSSVKDRYKENIIKQTCELAVLKYLHPRTAVTVTVQEMEDFGGLIACCLNAVCLALINSGLPMQYTFAAVWCIVDNDSNIIVDPQLGVESQATITFVFDSNNYELIDCITEGMISEQHYKEALAKCKQTSKSVFQFYRDIVSKYAKLL